MFDSRRRNVQTQKGRKPVQKYITLGKEIYKIL